jgi:hypothetical protein
MRWIKDLNITLKTMNLRGKNRGETLQNIGISKI